MGANRVPDPSNQDQLLEYAVQTATAPDGTKMGAKAVALPEVTGTPGQAVPSKATLIAGTDLTNLVPLTVSGGGGADGNPPTQKTLWTAAYLQGFNGSTWDRLRVDAQKNLLVGLRNSAGAEPGIASYGNGDGANATPGLLATSAWEMLFNGLTWDRRRGANVFKVLAVGSIASGTSVTVWTPAAGKKIRLMGVIFGAGGAGNHDLRTGTAGSGTRRAVIVTGGADSKIIDFGQGLLAVNANDVLEIFNNNAGAVSYNVTAWGTEE